MSSNHENLFWEEEEKVGELGKLVATETGKQLVYGQSSCYNAEPRTVEPTHAITTGRNLTCFGIS